MLVSWAMKATIQDTVTANSDHEIRFRDPGIPAGAVVDIIVSVRSNDAGAEASGDAQWLWNLVDGSSGTSSGPDVIARVREERDRWERE
jgi:hypothetical protein